MESFKRKQLAAAVFAVIGAGNAGAAGFQLFEQGASGLGTAYAAGASAEDANTIAWNPAGMTYLQGKNLSATLNLISPNAKFKNAGTRFENLPGPVLVTGGNGGDAGDLTPVPNLFYAHQVNPNLHVGVGMGSFYGLKTEYDKDWVGRYHGILSDLRTININPSLAYKVNNVVSLGGGLNLVRADAELSSAINFGLIANPALNQARDGLLKVEGDDWGYGFNLGAMFQVSPSTRVGVSYRSKVKIELEGDATYSLPATLAPALTAAGFVNTGITAEVNLPEIVGLNFYTDVNNRWAIMGDVTWTRWSRFDELRLKFENPTAVQGDAVTKEDWKDSYKIALGASYKLNQKWTLRGGIAYDKSPIKDEFRTPRIPDADRTWLAFGANVKVGTSSSIDIGYAHIFVDDPQLNKVSEESSAGLRTRLIGEYDASVDLFSLQFNHKF